MKKYSSTVKKYSRLLVAVIFAAVALLSPTAAIAQINITVNVLPPYSPYYADYSGASATKVLLIIQNTGAAQQKIKLSGKLQGDNGITISTRANFTPLQPIVLNPHEVKQLNGLALRDIFNLNNLNVYGVDKVKLVQSSRIPEGNYSFCLQALDYANGRILSANAPFGCTTISIIYPDAPVLMSPLPNEHIRATPVQNVILNWVNPGRVPIGTQYKLEIAEMPDVAKDPNQVLNATSFPILSTRVTGTTYVYSAANLALKRGKRYAWRVTGSDPTQRVLFKNNGISGASIFVYDPDETGTPIPGLPGAPLQPGIGYANNNQKGKNYSVGGHLTYKYHLTANEVNDRYFVGRRDTAIPLSHTFVQLCYGLCKVKMDITKTLATEVKQNKSPAGAVNGNTPPGVTLNNTINVTGTTPLGPQNPAKAVYVIDSILKTGKPQYPISPISAEENGVATYFQMVQTDANGNYSFNFKSEYPNRIVSVENNYAYIYCYYINVLDKRYTDPAEYIYAKTPQGNEISTVNAGTQNVFLKNHDLGLVVSRNEETGTDIGAGQGAKVEGTVDERVQVYVLRKGKPGADIPLDEGDNSGHVEFIPNDDTRPYLGDGDYYIVAKKDLYMSQYIGFKGETTFYNLPDNLDANDTYTIFAQYKNSKVFFESKEVSLEPDNDADYQPTYNQKTRHQSAYLIPKAVSVKVKGILKYRFKNGETKALANTWVSLESDFYTYQGNDNHKVYDVGGPKSERYDIQKTDENGYFELGANQILYQTYKSGNYFVAGGANQFIRVQSPYYGSPDLAYTFSAGNTYNVNEIIAQVKDYTLDVTISGANKSTKVNDLLGNQRVFLCRKPGFNGKDLGIPSDEGAQAGIPQKNIIDKSGNSYRVISYGETNDKGYVRFNRLVANDPLNGQDKYYLYTESGVLSNSNYSSEYVDEVYVSTLLKDYKLDGVPTSNTDILKVDMHATRSLTSQPQKPVIFGAVYPIGNISTNAMPGVKVYLYDIKTYTKKQFEAALATKAPLQLLEDLKAFGMASLQTYQITPANGQFSFDNPVDAQHNGWKVLVYAKPGFINTYSAINGGLPMGAGLKENVKGLLLPPRKLYVTVKDANTGKPVKAKIIVGDDFSWASTNSVKQDITLLGITTSTVTREEANLTSTYGNVKFTVIPEDNVNYQSQTFTRTIFETFDPVTYLPLTDNSVTVNIEDFLMSRPVNNVMVCLKDAVTGKSIGGFVSITGLPIAETPKGKKLQPLVCGTFNFETGMKQYGVKVTAPGYATQEVIVPANYTPNYTKSVTIAMQPGLTISGIVKVDNKPASYAKVYVKELAGQYPDVYTDDDGKYTIDGLPKTKATVTVVAVDAEKNALGQSQQVVLDTHVDSKLKIILYNITANFSLKTNNDINLSHLYGFEFDAESLTTGFDGRLLLSGRIKVPDNKSLKPSDYAYLTVKNMPLVKVDPTKTGNDKVQNRAATITPANSTITVTENTYNVLAFNKYQANLFSTTGIQLLPQDKTLSSGSINASLLLTSGGVNKGVSWDAPMVLFPADGNAENKKAQKPRTGAITGVDPFISYDTPTPYTGDDPYVYETYNEHPFNVFVTDAATDKVTKLQIESSAGGSFRYSLNHLYTAETTNQSYLNATGLHLFSTLYLKLKNVADPYITLDAGEVIADDKSVSPIVGKSDLNIPLDDWKLTGKWHIDKGAITLNGNLFAGTVTMPVYDMDIFSDHIGYGNISVSKIGLAGVYQMNIDSAKTFTSFGYDQAAKYGTLYDPKYGLWSLSLLATDQTQPLTELSGLKDLAPTDRIKIMNISLYSKGSGSRVMLMQNHPDVTLNGFANFSPSQIENGSKSFTINGQLDLKIPALTGLTNQVYGLKYTSDGTNLVHEDAALPQLNMVTNGIRIVFDTKGQTFTNNQLILPGILSDKVPSSPYNLEINLIKLDPGKQQLFVTNSTKNFISLGSDQKLAGITGGMAGTANGWNNFVFEGDVVASGMRATDADGAKKSHMVFEVKGDLVANKSQIGVQNMSFAGADGFNLTYDFEKKAIVGSFHVNEETSAATFDTDFEMMMGNSEWYFLGAAKISNITGSPLPVKGASGAVLIGNCIITADMMQIIQSKFHDGILPDDFDKLFKNLNGSLVVMGIDLTIPVPDIHLNIGPIAKVDVEKGVYINSYTGISFDAAAPVLSGGLKVGVYAKVNAGASLLVGCAGLGLSAEVNAQVSSKLTLPTFAVIKSLSPPDLLKATGISIKGSGQAILSGEAYVGYGVCDADCSSISIGGFTIPPGCNKMGIGKTLNLDFGMEVAKDTGTFTPNTSTIWLDIMGYKKSVSVNLPHLGEPAK